jgi:hypothetical protein
VGGTAVSLPLKTKHQSTQVVPKAGVYIILDMFLQILRIMSRFILRIIAQIELQNRVLVLALSYEQFSLEKEIRD